MFLSPQTISHSTKHVALSPVEFRSLKLSEKRQVTPHMSLFRFPYTECDQISGCKAGEYLAIRTVIDNETVIRYYSPVSSPNDPYIDLLIKIDDKGGKMSWYFRDMKIGDTMEFKGPISGFQYSQNMVPEIGLIAGGAGISPMLQIVREITKETDDKTKIKMLYGSTSIDEFAFKDELEHRQEKHPDQLQVSYTVDWLADEDKNKWSGNVGYISKQLLEQYMPKPSSNCMIVFCGPPAMISNVERMLKELGYSNDQYYKYG